MSMDDLTRRAETSDPYSLSTLEITGPLSREYEAVTMDMWDHVIMDRPDLLRSHGIHCEGSGQAVLAAEFVPALAGAREERR